MDMVPSLDRGAAHGLFASGPFDLLYILSHFEPARSFDCHVQRSTPSPGQLGPALPHDGDNGSTKPPRQRLTTRNISQTIAAVIAIIQAVAAAAYPYRRYSNAFR